MAEIKIYEQQGKKFLIIPTVDFEADVEILKQTDKVMFCRKKGHTGWIGRGSTGYTGPAFIIFKMKSKNEVVNGMGESYFEYNRENKKEILKKAFKEFEELDKI